MEKNIPKKAEKLTIEEYQKLKAKKAKIRFSYSFPWPVKIALALPTLFFIILVLGYAVYIHRLTK